MSAPVIEEHDGYTVELRDPPPPLPPRPEIEAPVVRTARPKRILRLYGKYNVPWTIWDDLICGAILAFYAGLVIWGVVWAVISLAAIVR